jgi:hypothetical protein
MMDFFENIINFFNKEEIPYMLTGSMAMSIYTVGRTTIDFDFVVNLKYDDVSKVVAHFRDGFYCDEDAIADALRRKTMFNIIDHQTSYKADFIILKDDQYEQVKFTRRAKVPVLGTEAYVIAGEDLLISKLMWIQQLQSGRQMEDLKAISKFSDLDWDYIHRWIRSLNLHTFDLFENK